MAKLNVMVTGAKGGRAHAIMKALLRSPTLAGLGLRVYPVDITPFAAGLYARTGTEGTVLPRLEDDFAAWEAFIQEKQIDFIFPTSDLDLVPLSSQRLLWRDQLGCQVMVSPLYAVEIANDKFMTFTHLYKTGVPTPESYSTYAGLCAFSEFYAYPFVVKPRFGANSRGINKVNNSEELEFYFAHTPDPIVQEYIDGDEYSGAITYDKDGEAKLFFVTRVYERRGHMTFGEVGDYPQIEAFLREFAIKTRPLGFSHALNVQMIQRGDQVYVIELNAVCSGSTAIRSHFGFNQPEQLILHHRYDMPLERTMIERNVGYAPTSGLVMTVTEEMFFEGVTREQMAHSSSGIHGKFWQSL